MDQEKIDRINVLYHKAKKEGLTAKELAEQKDLRQEYLQAIRRNLRASLDKVKIQNPDGSIRDLKSNS